MIALGAVLLVLTVAVNVGGQMLRRAGRDVGDAARGARSRRRRRPRPVAGDAPAPAAGAPALGARRSARAQRGAPAA